MNLRCAYCKKAIPAGKAISHPTGLHFDSVRCRDQYLASAPVKGLQNVVRVARSRQKSAIISKAKVVYRGLRGRDWPKVEQLLRAVL